MKYLITMPYEPDGRFLVLMESFLQEATQSFDKMYEAKVEMKKKVTILMCSVIT